MTGCTTVTRKQRNIPENLMVKCDELKKFSEFTKTSTMEDHIEYTKFLMESLTTCRIGKEDLINAVREEQNQK